MIELTNGVQISEDRLIQKATASVDSLSSTGKLEIMQYDDKMPVAAVTLTSKAVTWTPPERSALRVRMGKPDGHGVLNDALGMDADGTVYFAFTRQMTAAHGTGEISVEIGSEGGVKSSAIVPVTIKKNPVQDDKIESGDEYLALADIVAAVQGSVDAANAAAEQAKQYADQAGEVPQAVADLGFPKIEPVAQGKDAANLAGGDVVQAQRVNGPNFRCTIQVAASSSYGIVGFTLADSYQSFADDEIVVTLKNLADQSCTTTLALTNNPAAWGNAAGTVFIFKDQRLTLAPGEVRSLTVRPADYAAKYQSKPEANQRFCVLVAKKASTDSNTQDLMVCFYNGTGFARCQGFDSSRVLYPLRAVQADTAATAQSAQTAAFARSANPLDFLPQANYTLRTTDKDTGTPTLTLDKVQGFVDYHKPQDTKCVYAGVYLHIPSDWLQDTLCLDLSATGSVSELHLLNGIKDWGDCPAKYFLNNLDKKSFSIRSILEANPSYYADPDSVYLSVLRYGSAGVADAMDFRVRLRNLSRDDRVVASDLTDELRADLLAAMNDPLAQPDRYITCWGDSLTAMGGWTDTLQSLSGLPVYNGGTGGEDSKTILARQGGDVMVVNDLQIPAQITPVVLANRTADKGIMTWFGNKVTPLLQGGAHVNPCLLGTVEGTLAWNGADYADTNGSWTFTRSAAGEAVTIDRPTTLRTDFDLHRNAPYLMILYMGQNGGWSDNDDLIWQHQRMIDHAHAKNVLVLGLSSGSAESRQSYEAAMQREFGRYFLSLRQYLAHPIYDGQGTAAENIVSCYGLADAGLTPTDQDLDAIRTGTVPPQCLIDSVHYTTATRTVIGQLIYKYCRELNLF